MKLIAFRDATLPTMAVLTADGRASALTAVDAFYADLTRWSAIARERSSAGQKGDLDVAQLTQVPAVPMTARVWCVGLNYRAHAAEGGNQVAPFPTMFGRYASTLAVNGADVPALDERLDWEGELGVIVGQQLYRVDEATAAKAVFGYAAFNDISARTYQRHTTQWTLGKNADGSGPMGHIVTADETGDPAAGWPLETRLNGQVMQRATTADMVYSVPRVLAYISEVSTLQPGDLIASGTPEGVGHARKPPLFMKPGDVVEVEIGPVGVLRNRIVVPR
jgi:2,4-didehydro-3-deoxy-L-rhamnonate hydrolase